MAHNIQQYDKHQGIEQAWHGLTEIVPDLSLDNNFLATWDLVSEPLNFRDGTGSGFSVLRCSDVPKIIGAPYNPLTFVPILNSEFIALVRACLAGTDHKIVSVGSVRNRGRVFISIELQGREKFSAAGREFSAFLNFGNGHDKSSVLWVNTSNTCTVCDNTFSMNLFSVESSDPSATATDENDLKIRQRHTKNAKMRFPEIASLVDQAIGVQAQFAANMDILAGIPLDNALALFAGFVGRNVPDAKKGLSARSFNTSHRLFELYRRGRGNKGENLADAFSAVTDYYTHESSGGDNKMKQVLSSEYGAGQNAKAEFWKILLDPETVTKMTARGVELLTNVKD